VNESGKILFSEVQRFSLLLIMPLVLLFLVAIGLEGHMIFRPALVGEEPWPVWALPVSILGIAINIAVTVILIFLKLETRVETDALYLRFFPFHILYKKISFDDIALVYARTYQPLSEFGGWGIKWGSNGKAYNVSGNRGVQLELKDGKKILIGSQYANELAAQLQEAMFHSRLASYADEQSQESARTNSSDSSLGQAG
jgi:hypothetical protein